MKNILRYIGFTLAGMAILASCNKNLPPVFDDKNAFVAFDQVAVSVAEDGKNLLIPVTLASVAGLEETVKFEIRVPDKKTGTEAEKGTNYELVTESGVLSFDAENRTRYIEIKPKHDGKNTGDLSFEIELFGTETLNVGSENICKVTITDIDHPLNFLFGEYVMSATLNTNGALSAAEWTMKIAKDAKDQQKIWFYNLGDTDRLSPEIIFYGTVSNDQKTVTISYGQETEYKYGGTTPVTFLGVDAEENIIETGAHSISISRDGDKVTLDFGKENGLYFYIEGAGYVTYMPAGRQISAVKK